VSAEYTTLWIRFLCLCTAQLVKNSDPSQKKHGTYIYVFQKTQPDLTKQNPHGHEMKQHPQKGHKKCKQGRIRIFINVLYIGTENGSKFFCPVTELLTYADSKKNRHGTPGGGRWHLKISGKLDVDPCCLFLKYGRRRPPGSIRKINAASATINRSRIAHICGSKVKLLWYARGWL